MDEKKEKGKGNWLRYFPLIEKTVTASCLVGKKQIYLTETEFLVMFSPPACASLPSPHIPSLSINGKIVHHYLSGHHPESFSPLITALSVQPTGFNSPALFPSPESNPLIFYHQPKSVVFNQSVFWSPGNIWRGFPGGSKVKNPPAMQETQEMQA